MNNNLAIIITAAGCSSRLGKPKQLIEYKGLSLLRRIATMSKNITETVVCVTGYNFERTSQEVADLEIQTVVNPNWQQGMGSSIAHGLSHMGDNIDAVLILLCDQWALSLQDLESLVSHWEKSQNKIVASHYYSRSNKNKIVGVPAILPRHYFAQLAQLKELGARKIILNNIEQVVQVPLNNAAFDLDTQKDYDLFKKMTK